MTVTTNEMVLSGKDGKPITTSLIVAEIFGKEHKRVMQDIRELSCSEEFRQHNFVHTPYVHPQNRQTYHYYTMTKDGFTFLVMGYVGKRAGEFKEKFINRFNEMEAKLQQNSFQIPQTYSEALLLAANQAKEIENLQHENKQLVSENQRNQPKAEFADCIMQSEDCISIGEMANILKQNGLFRKGQNAFFEWLRYNGYLICRGVRYNLPTQKSMNRGLMKIAERPSMFDGGVTINRKAVVTPLGQKFFIDLFRKTPNNVFTPNGLFG